MYRSPLPQGRWDSVAGAMRQTYHARAASAAIATGIQTLRCGSRTSATVYLDYDTRTTAITRRSAHVVHRSHIPHSVRHSAMAPGASVSDDTMPAEISTTDQRPTQNGLPPHSGQSDQNSSRRSHSLPSGSRRYARPSTWKRASRGVRRGHSVEMTSIITDP